MLDHQSKTIDKRIPIILIVALLAFALVMLRESSVTNLSALDCKCACTHGSTSAQDDAISDGAGGYGPRLSNLENNGAGGNSAELLQQ